MNQKILVTVLLLFLLTAIYPAFAQDGNFAQASPSSIPFNFTFLISDKSLYKAGDVIDFEAVLVNNSTEFDLAVFITAKAAFLDDGDPSTNDTLVSKTVIIPKEDTGSIKMLLPSRDDIYGVHILRVEAYGQSTTNASISQAEYALFQVHFEDEPVSRLPLIGFLVVVAAVIIFVLRSTRSDLDEL